MDGPRRLASVAAARIAAGALNRHSVPELAKELCVGERQLRRAMKEELGVSPVQLAQTHRLLMAKRLLTDSRLSVSQIAYSAGFSSLRRFNALFQKRYGLTPSKLRKIDVSQDTEETGWLELDLSYRPPFDWASLLAFLSRRATPGVEAVSDGQYTRTVVLGEHRGTVELRHEGDNPGSVAVRISIALAPALPALLVGLRGLLDLDAAPEAISEHLGRDPRLRPLVHRFPGLRVPGAIDGFELGVRAVLGQQVTVRAATTLAGRLACEFGDATITSNSSLTRYPVQPQVLADADPARIASIGMPVARARAVHQLARAMATGALRLDPGAPVESTLEALEELPGIGSWTAHYIALRALHWPDAFPVGDAGLRRALGTRSVTELNAIAEPWRPWRAYAVMYLWHAESQPAVSAGRP